MSPEPGHDDIARFNFLANFNKYMSSTVVGGNAVAWQARARPRWEQLQHGRPPRDRREIRDAMATDPYYQMWSRCAARRWRCDSRRGARWCCARPKRCATARGR